MYGPVCSNIHDFIYRTYGVESIDDVRPIQNVCRLLSFRLPATESENDTLQMGKGQRMNRFYVGTWWEEPSSFSNRLVSKIMHRIKMHCKKLRFIRDNMTREDKNQRSQEGKDQVCCKPYLCPVENLRNKCHH